MSISLLIPTQKKQRNPLNKDGGAQWPCVNCESCKLRTSLRRSFSKTSVIIITTKKRKEVGFISQTHYKDFHLYRTRTLVPATNHYKRRGKHRIYRTRISGYIEQTASPNASTFHSRCLYRMSGVLAVSCQVR